MEQETEEKRRLKTCSTQLRLAAGVTIAGVAIIVAGFVVSPLGEIHSSVLVAFGECLTFGGSLLGIDYRYKNKE